MNILVTGIQGQLAQALVEVAKADRSVTILPVGRPELDLAEPGTIGPAIARRSPDVIVSAAAYTAVDRAESEPVLARRVNVDGPAALARAADRLGIAIIHISTDYVFPGDKGSAYVEGDRPAPINVYGQTKLEGETAVLQNCARSTVLRTSWVHSPFSGNFVRTMLKLATNTHGPVRVVADQIGSPTSALDLAEAVLRVARMTGGDTGGLFHVCNRGSVSRAEFARYIFAVRAEAGGRGIEVVEIPTKDYPTPAPRPGNSSLNCDLFEKTFDWEMPGWQASVRAVTHRCVACG